jgi:hypothetical protein
MSDLNDTPAVLAAMRRVVEEGERDTLRSSKAPRWRTCLSACAPRSSPTESAPRWKSGGEKAMSVDSLHRRVLRLLHQTAVLPNEAVMRRVWTDPERKERRQRMLTGDLALAEIDRRYPAPEPLRGEADQHAARARLAQACERQIALAGWAARRLDLLLLDHGFDRMRCACPARIAAVGARGRRCPVCCARRRSAVIRSR